MYFTLARMGTMSCEWYWTVRASASCATATAERRAQGYPGYKDEGAVHTVAPLRLSVTVTVAAIVRGRKGKSSARRRNPSAMPKRAK